MSRHSPDNEFEIRDDVPVLDEHVLHDRDGNEIATITADMLETIARNNNRRIKETGDEVPLIPGHTKDHLSELEQPPILGYADKFRVGWLKGTGRKAIFARFKYFKNTAADVMRRFPRRSVELWLRKMEIDPISLLGATTPERSLGLVRMSSADGLHYSREFEDASMDSSQNSGIVQEVLAAIQQTAEWQALKQMVGQQDGGQPEQEGPPDMGGGEPSAQEPGRMKADYGAEDYEGDGDGYEPQKVRSGLTKMRPTVAGASPMKPQYDADAMSDGDEEHYAGFHDDTGGRAQPSARGGSTHTMGERQLLPSKQSHHIMGHGHMSGNIPHRSVPSGMHGRLQRDDLRIRLARQERELDIERQINRQNAQKIRLAERERDLIQLSAEGVLFQRERLLDRGMRMRDEDWAGYLEEIRENYHRDPARVSLGPVLQFSREGNVTHERTRDESMQIADYASKNGLTYEQALDKFHGQHTA